MQKFNLNKTALLGATMAALLAVTGCNKEAKTAAQPAEIKLDAIEQKVTYIVGYNMAQQAKANGLEFQKDIMATAIQDVLEGKEPRIAQADQQQIMMTFQEQQQTKREAERKVQADANLKQAQTFLAENAKKEGVKTTASGLQYEVLQAAPKDAKSPKEEDTVKVHYHGTLVDGTVFDSSVERGQPVSFPVKGVISGWVEALQLMKVGDKFKLYIPPELGYGEAGTSGKIGPNAALVFEVELLAINPDVEEHHKPK
jgi:FKBP-type peptidyl-prolyl cis-trans isomerase